MALVEWLRSGPDSEPVRLGMPDMAPAIAWREELMPLFAESSSILSTILSPLQLSTDAIELVDDGDWLIHPELAKEITKSSLRDECFCVATCKEKSRWAVGLASNKKRRTKVARLALCVAFAEDLPDFSSLEREVPGFIRVCNHFGFCLQPAGDGNAVTQEVVSVYDESYWRQLQLVEACDGKCEHGLFLYCFPQCKDDKLLHRSLLVTHGRLGRKWVMLRGDNRIERKRALSAPPTVESQLEDMSTAGYSKACDSQSASKGARHH